MSKGSTRAIEALRAAGTSHRIHHYRVARVDGANYGRAVAAELGVSAARVFKTLVARADGSPAVGIVPAAGTLSLKRLAAVLGAKRAVMAAPDDAERLTGYVVGGISPFGRKRAVPVVVHRTVLDHETVFVSGGRRGIQLEVDPADLVRLTAARVADLVG